MPAAPSRAPNMQWLEQAPLFSAPWLPCSPCLILGNLQMHQKGSTGFGLHCMEIFMGPSLESSLAEWSRIHPAVSPCPHESLWDLILWLWSWFKEQQQLNKAFPYLRHEAMLSFSWGSGFQPRNQESKHTSSWAGDRKVTLSAKSQLKGTALAQPLIYPSRIIGKHCTAQQPASYIDFCPRGAHSENLGIKMPKQPPERYSSAL